MYVIFVGCESLFGRTFHVLKERVIEVLEFARKTI